MILQQQGYKFRNRQYIKCTASCQSDIHQVSKTNKNKLSLSFFVLILEHPHIYYYLCQGIQDISLICALA